MLIGADPGVGGAIAILFDDGRYADVIDMPLREMKGATKKWHEVDVIALDQAVETWRTVYQDERYRLAIESQFVMRQPEQGGTANPFAIMRLGESRGMIRGVLEPKFGQATMISPSAWKRRLNVPKDKKASLDIARRIFPQAPLTLQKHHNRGEALLICRWLFEFGGTT
jgi:hypothetical protein